MSAAAKIHAKCKLFAAEIADLERQIETKRAELRGLHIALDAIAEGPYPLTSQALEILEAQEAKQPATTALPTAPSIHMNTGTIVSNVPSVPSRPAESTDGWPQPASLAYEILGVLEEMLADHPKGPTVKAIAAHLGEDEYNVRKACQALANKMHAQFMLRKDTGAHHLFPIDRKPPLEELTPRQQAVLSAMISLADENRMVTASQSEIAQLANESAGNLGVVTYALSQKGRIEIIKRQSPAGSNSYRILEPAISEHTSKEEGNHQ